MRGDAREALHLLQLVLLNRGIREETVKEGKDS